MVSAYDFMPKYVFLNLQMEYLNHDCKCLNEQLQDIYFSTVLQVI